MAEEICDRMTSWSLGRGPGPSGGLAEAASSSLAGIDPHCAPPSPTQGIAALSLTRPKKETVSSYNMPRTSKSTFYTLRVPRKITHYYTLAVNYALTKHHAMTVYWGVEV